MLVINRHVVAHMSQVKGKIVSSKCKVANLEGKFFLFGEVLSVHAKLKKLEMGFQPTVLESFALHCQNPSQEMSDRLKRIARRLGLVNAEGVLESKVRLITVALVQGEGGGTTLRDPMTLETQIHDQAPEGADES